MCGNGFGGNNCWWIIILILLFCCCGNGNGNGNNCGCVTSVVSDSVRPHRRQTTRLPHPWDSPGKNTGVSYHFLL